MVPHPSEPRSSITLERSCPRSITTSESTMYGTGIHVCGGRLSIDPRIPALNGIQPFAPIATGVCGIKGSFLERLQQCGNVEC